MLVHALCAIRTSIPLSPLTVKWTNWQKASEPCWSHLAFARLLVHGVCAVSYAILCCDRWRPEQTNSVLTLTLYAPVWLWFALLPHYRRWNVRCSLGRTRKIDIFLFLAVLQSSCNTYAFGKAKKKWQQKMKVQSNANNNEMKQEMNMNKRILLFLFYFVCCHTHTHTRTHSSTFFRLSASTFGCGKMKAKEARERARGASRNLLFRISDPFA